MRARIYPKIFRNMGIRPQSDWPAVS